MGENGRGLFEDSVWHPYYVSFCTKVVVIYHTQDIPCCYAKQVTRKGGIRNALFGKREGKSSMVRWEDNIKKGGFRNML